MAHGVQRAGGGGQGRSCASVGARGYLAWRTEQLARPLVQAGLLRSVRGKGGGYALAQEAAAIKAGDVLRAVEGTTAPSRASTWRRAWPAPRARECTTVRFWPASMSVIERYVDGVTLADLAGEPGSLPVPASRGCG